MKSQKLQKTTLIVAGVTAMLIGLFIALDPIAFYSGYGIALQGNTDMLSELRAAGVNLTTLGGIMLAGALRASFRELAIAASLIVFTSYAAGRTFSLAIDGWPSEKVLGAVGIELLIAAVCLVAFLVQRRAASME